MAFLDRFLAILLALVAVLNSAIYFALAFSFSDRDTLILYAVFAVVAIIGASVWIRRSETIDSNWLMYLLQFVIAAGLLHIMIWYGAAKLLPGGQFGIPPLIEAEKPYYALSPFWKAFAFFWHSAVYNASMAIPELMGGLLLFFDRTRRLALCILLPVLVNICLVNIAFDIGILWEATLLLVMTLYLLAHDYRWFRASFWSHEALPEPKPAQFSGRQRRGVIIAKVPLAVAIAAQTVYIGVKYVPPPHSVLYGIWSIDHSIPPSSWTKIYFDEEEHGQIRDAGQLRKITYDVDEVHHRLTLRTDPNPVPLLAGAYELKGNDLLLTAGDRRLFLRRVH